MDEETDISSKRTAKSSSSSRGSKKTKPKKTKKSESEERSKGSNELSLSVKNSKNIEKCLSYLKSYFTNLNTSDLDNVITEKNLKNFEKLGELENIQVDLLLTKLYHKIICSESLYTSYFSDYEENESKIELALGFLDEVLKNVENFDNDLISLENFELKENVLKLIKFMKINLKEALDKDEIKQLDSYINDLPNQFYSKNYLELMKYKTKNKNELLKDIEKIDELLSNLQSYYEQLSAIENLFGDLEQDTKNYISVSKKDIKKKKKKKKSRRKNDSDEEEEDEEDEDDTDTTDVKEEKEKITEEDLINYGQFLVNICIYQQYELKSEKKEVTKKKQKKSSQKEKQKSKQKQKPSKNKSKKKSTEEEEENEEEEEEEENENEEEKEDDNEAEEDEEEEESEDDPETCSKVFLLDVAQKSTGKKKKKVKKQ